MRAVDQQKKKKLLHYCTTLPLLCCAMFLFFLLGCATARYEIPTLRDYMVASWYGEDFHGKPTASGQRYNMHALTCAHKSLPFGTRLRVTNSSNGKSVDVIVNDRGPFVKGRDIDLSYGAAKKIGMIGTGTARVRVEYIDRDKSYIKNVDYAKETDGPFTIQVGSFKEQENAERLKDSLELNYEGVYITTIEINGEKYYRVRIGRFNTRDRAFRNADVLAEEGYDTMITSYDEEI